MRLNLKTLRLDVEETGPRRVRVERARDAHTKVDFEVTEQREKLHALEAIRDDNTATISTMGQSSLHFVLLALGVGLVAVDAVVQFVVNSSTISALSPQTWLLVSPFIAVGLGGLTHGVAQALTYDPTRPQRSVRRCLQYAGVFGTACAIALGVFLFSRTANEELVPYLVGAVAASLWTLAEALPITAGLLSAAAHHLSYPALHARRIRRVKERLAELDTFVQWLEDEERRLEALAASTPSEDDADSGTPSAAATPAPAPVPGRRSIAAAGLLLALVGPSVMACTRAAAAPAVDSNAPVTRDSPVSPLSSVVLDHRTTGDIGLAPETICHIYIDDTGSVDPTSRARVLETLADGLPAFLDAFGCHELRVGHFSNQGAFAPMHAFLVPGVPATPTCGTPAPTTGTRALPVLFFDQFADYYKKQGRSLCEQQQHAAIAAAQGEQDHFLKNVRAVITQPRIVDHACTAISPIIEHALVRGSSKRVLVLVTDAADTCSGTSRPIHLSDDARLVLVLLPSAGPIGDRGPEALARARYWEGRVSGVTVALFQDLPAWRWADLARPSARH